MSRNNFIINSHADLFWKILRQAKYENAQRDQISFSSKLPSMASCLKRMSRKFERTRWNSIELQPGNLSKLKETPGISREHQGTPESSRKMKGAQRNWRELERTWGNSRELKMKALSLPWMGKKNSTTTQVRLVQWYQWLLIGKNESWKKEQIRFVCAIVCMLLHFVKVIRWQLSALIQ